MAGIDEMTNVLNVVNVVNVMLTDVMLSDSESKRLSVGRKRLGRRRDAATERGRRRAHIVGAGET